jgi:hypothetical protein
MRNERAELIMPKSSPSGSKPKGLKFEHQVQHTIESFDRLTSLARQPLTSPRHALSLAEELLSHGHPDTLKVTALLRQNPHRDVVRRGIMLEKCFDQLRARLHVEEVDRKHIVRAYRKDGYLLFESAQKSRKLLVVFTTIFNNFFISHLNLHAMLRDLGCHLLFLKDTTLSNYQRGVASFASDFPDIAVQIQATARKLGADQIYLSGYSSGGYPALQTSLRMACQGYLGFSHSTDLSPGSALPHPAHYSAESFAQLDARWLVDLRVSLQQADPAVPRVLIYGEQAWKDSAHAEHVAGLKTIRLVRLAGASHDTVKFLLARGRFTEAFRRLVADR